jgi:hypothetical protein
MLSTSTPKFIERELTAEGPKVAMSVGAFGTVFGVQLAVLFQSPFLGLRFQVAVPANERATIRHNKTQRTGKSLFISRSQQKAAEIARQYQELRLDH